MTKLFSVGFIFLSGSAFGAPPSLGSTAASFLKLGVGPRPVAMGEAFTGLADDVNAIFYNPAGLGLLKRQELTLMHNELFSGVRQEWLAYAHPSGRWGTLGVSANVVHVQPFDAFDNNDVPGSKISAQDAAYTLAYSRGFGRWLSLGAAGKFVKSRLDNLSASAVAFDAGLLYDTSIEGLRAGLSAHNMGSRMKFINERYILPRSLRGGLSYHLALGAEKAHEFTFLADMVDYRDSRPFAAVGAEYFRHKVLALRAGWRQTTDSGYGLTLGAGFCLNRGGDRFPEISFDYAFVGAGEMGQSHRAGVTVKFGPTAGLERPAAKKKYKAPAKGRKDASDSEMMWINP